MTDDDAAMAIKTPEIAEFLNFANTLFRKGRSNVSGIVTYMGKQYILTAYYDLRGRSYWFQKFDAPQAH